MPGLIIKSNIKKTVQELQGQNEEVTSVAEDLGIAMERKVEEMLRDAIKRARENNRKTLLPRDL